MSCNWWDDDDCCERKAGPQGAMGAQGNSVRGYQGPMGVQGIEVPGRGAQGFEGSQGPTNIGTRGSQGAQGVAALFGVDGFQGEDGNAGNTDLQGFDGINGPQGNQGSHAIGIQGYTGVSAVSSLGPQGERGSQGSLSYGAQGVSGFTQWETVRYDITWEANLFNVTATTTPTDFFDAYYLVYPNLEGSVHFLSAAFQLTILHATAPVFMVVKTHGVNVPSVQIPGTMRKFTPCANTPQLVTFQCFVTVLPDPLFHISAFFWSDQNSVQFQLRNWNSLTIPIS